jgi:hypothetical protein
MPDTGEPKNLEQAAVDEASNRLPGSSNRAGKRVAVVAVHGVAYHEPGSSANAVSELLLGLPQKDGRPKYAPLQAETLHVPLHPLAVKKRLEPINPGFFQWLFGGLEERTSFMTRAWKTLRESKDSSARVADDFMTLTLQDYRGVPGNSPKDARDACAYVTTRLKTIRTTGNPNEGTPSGLPVGGKPVHHNPFPETASTPRTEGVSNGIPTQVDVYEMYWADLSRPKGTLLNFFQSLYQLLFHLASLSRLAVSTGSLENRELWQWRWFDRAQVYAVRMLTLPIPILNVLLFATVIGLAPKLVTDLSSPVHAQWAATIGAALLGILAYTYRSNTIPAGRSSAGWAASPLILAVALGGLAYWASPRDPQHILPCVEGLLVGSIILKLIAVSYDDVRDGATTTAWILWGLWVLTIVLLWVYGQPDSIEQAILWTMQIVLGALRISWMLLFVFAFSAFVLGGMAWRSIDRKQEDRRARAKAAVRTSRIALAMPAMGILVITVAIYSGLFVKATTVKGQYGNSIAARLFGNTIKPPLNNSSPYLKYFFLILGETDVNRFLDESSATVTVKAAEVKESTKVTISADYDGRTQDARVVVNPTSPILTVDPPTVTAGEPVTVTVALNKPKEKELTAESTVNLRSSDPGTITVPPSVTVVPIASTSDPAATPHHVTTMQPNTYFEGLFVWSATPGFWVALLVMIFGLFLLVLWVTPSIFTEQDSPVRSTNNSSVRMGKWLSRGLDATKIVTCLAWCSAFLLPSLFGILYGDPIFNKLQGLFPWLKSPSATMVAFTSGTIEYIGIGVTSAAVLAGLAGSGSTALGIILDVDNYLRTSPNEATPRARIMERYVSLIRFLSGDKDATGGKYDRIVIVAHSLGALISGDLLLYLMAQSDSPEIEIYLFSMGNPVRQLLNRFFPFLYEWVRPIPDNSLGPLKDPAQAPPVIGSDVGPDPRSLGVARWVSAYRSGDYVGRSLWLDEWYNREASAGQGETYVAKDSPGLREEMCIGAGAHQHYWDQSAPDIAEKLDELIWS